ncbi:MAG: hypothetical protein AAFR58_19870 [Cyanobacteria bacterium J06627_28]
MRYFSLKKSFILLFLSAALSAILSATFLGGCSSYYSSSGLTDAEEDYLTEIDLLDNNEDVLFFSSGLGIKQEGNFFTDKRVATYWIEPERPHREKRVSADYSEIADISIAYSSNSLYAHKITVTRIDGSQFPVYIGFRRAIAQDFFEALIKQWQQEQWQQEKQ